MLIRHSLLNNKIAQQPVRTMVEPYLRFAFFTFLRRCFEGVGMALTAS